MTRPPLTALLLSDGKPGHYRQAEGVIAAMARLRPVTTVRLELRRRRLVATRTLQHLFNLGMPAAALLRLGYGLRASDLPAADIVVSGGGETLAANVTAAKLLDVPNVFCGSLRRLAPENFSLTIAQPETAPLAPNQLAVLAPSPTVVPRPAGAAAGSQTRFGRDNPPRRVGVLIGGNSGEFTYSNDEWVRLGGFLREAHAAHGIAWIATTSRRSGDFVGDMLAVMAGDPACGLVKFVDFRAAGPGTVADIFGEAEAILCTDNSNAMVQEAIGACLPVVAVRPKVYALDPRDIGFHDHLTRQGWYRAVAIADLTPELFLRSLEEIVPRTTSQVDELAAGLRQRLPELFAG